MSIHGSWKKYSYFPHLLNFVGIITHIEVKDLVVVAPKDYKGGNESTLVKFAHST
jgi:hypothetical protein